MLFFLIIILTCLASTNCEPFPKLQCESLLVNCTCDDFEVVVGITCKNDFSNFANVLATGKIFEINETYEITLYNIHYLPARVLNSLIVYRLTLDDPHLLEIDENVFEGVYRLRRFHVRRSQIQNFPDFRTIKHSIRNINVDNSRISSLKGQRLQDLTLLETISFFNNSIRYIEADVFKGTEGLIIFDLSYNLLTYLPPNLLDKWIKLRKLVLSHNQLLHVNQLFAVTHPRFIFLDFNNITEADTILYPNMTNVETVVFASNPIAKTSELTFQGKVPNVRFIYLDHCLLHDFDVKHFQELNSLNLLDLSYNLLEEVKNQTIQVGESLELDLIGNRIKSFNAVISFVVKRIYLDENKLQSLGNTLRLTQMEEVSVARNELQYLSAQDFQGVHGTANLELQGNKIQWIDRFTFNSTRNDLHYLDLSCNLIPALNGSIRFLSQLKLLNITNNLIETFEPLEFTGLNELSEIYLQHNRIIDLNGQLQLLPQLQYLVVSHNNIHHLSQNQIPKSLKFLFLKDNPIDCHCRLFPFLLWLQSNSSPKTDTQLCPPSNSTNFRSSTICPDMCSCSCTEEGPDSYMFLNCSSKNLTTIPSFLTNDFFENRNISPITSMVFEQSTNPYFHIQDRVLGIDLQNNSIASISTAKLNSNLFHLYLARNNLRSLPETVYKMEHLKKVSLSENPWDCDCKAVDFKIWLLSKLNVVQDVNFTVCGRSENDLGLDGKIIWTLLDLDLCPDDMVRAIVGFGVLGFIVMVMTGIILYIRYEMTIKAYLYSNGFTCVKEEDLDKDKIFDAFICCSKEEELFVKDILIPTLEKECPDTRLCFHSRDFMPGAVISTQIIESIRNSKRAVFMVSSKFLKSEWCIFEFDIALRQTIKDKINRVLVIKVGDLPEDIYPSVSIYIDTYTYLEWGEKDFWRKLKLVLPNSRPPNKKCCSFF